MPRVRLLRQFQREADIWRTPSLQANTPINQQTKYPHSPNKYRKQSTGTERTNRAKGLKRTKVTARTKSTKGTKATKLAL